MKSHINLVSREILFEEKPFPFKQVAVPMALSAAVILLILASLGYAWRVRVLNKEVRGLAIQRDKTQQELARLNGEIGGLTQQTQTNQASAAQQREAMRDLLKNRIPWSDVVREVSFMVPEGVWLTQMESFDSKPAGLFPPATGKTVRFIGVAQSQAAVNHFISALERSPRYGSVSLVYTQKGGGEGVQGVSFELIAALH
jgi:Tfp pilus assembly protein PilN